jgi:hypothetical protein
LLWTWKQTTFSNNESLLPFPLIPRYIHWCLQSYTSALTFPNPSLCVSILSRWHILFCFLSVLFCLTFFLLRVHSLVVGVMEVASNPQITHIQHKYIQKKDRKRIGREKKSLSCCHSPTCESLAWYLLILLITVSCSFRNRYSSFNCTFAPSSVISHSPLSPLPKSQPSSTLLSSLS